MSVENRMNVPPDGYLSVDDTCARLGREIWFVRKLINQRQLQHIVRKEGLCKRSYVEVVSLERYITSHRKEN